ncbi:hypothetical protein FGO68_gene9231 [Halteria grandinella]|uniref:Cadherin domain-containing protein n=1 Tax=Halteria grandinella TaxID=5974 RepID=A0A8J8T9G1_HALGN|nr:hypothetical protein FGO68_gene9231 [Halteria grandinella]
MCNLFTKLVLLLLVLPHRTLQICINVQAPFPKVVGGITNPTYIFQVDYNQVTNYLVGVGQSYEQQLRNDALGSTNKPIIVAYKSETFTYAWGKSFGTSGLSSQFSGIKINSAGTRLVVANQDAVRYLIVIDIANGNVVYATKLTATVSYDYFTRNLLLLDSGNILMGDSSSVIITYPSSDIATVKSMGGLVTYNLHSNVVQNRVYVFSYATHTCRVSFMHMDSFAHIYQFSVQCSSVPLSALVQTFQSCVYDDGTSETVAFQEDTKFFRIKQSSSIATSTVHDPATPSLKGRGLHCMSHNQFYSLMFGSYGSSATNRFYIAEVNFLKSKITYRRYLQEIYGSIYQGVIFESDKFFFAGYSTAIQVTPSASFSPGSQVGVGGGIIYGTMLTCQQIDSFTNPVADLTVNAYIFDATSIAFESSTRSVSDEIMNLPLPTSINEVVFEAIHASECGIYVPQEPYDFEGLSSYQQNYAMSYSNGPSDTLAIPIQPFTANPILIAFEIYSFTYSLKSFNGPLGGITVDSSSGEITIPSIAALGARTYNLVIEGKLIDCQTISAKFTLGASNTLPSFMGITGTTLDIVSAELGLITDFQLPSIVDPDTEQTITVTLTEAGGSAFPSFIDFSDSTHTVLRIQPGATIVVTTYQLGVRLSDGLSQATYTLFVMVEASTGTPPPPPPPSPPPSSLPSPPIPPTPPVPEVVPPPPIDKSFLITNSGPPIFTSPLETITLKLGQSTTYTLPTQTDPDNDNIDISIDLKETTAFAQYSGQKFTFLPQKGGKYKTEYEIAIVLADDNKDQKRSNYKLKVIIESEKDKEVETGPEVNGGIPANPKAKLIKCSIKIVEVSRDSHFKLKITSSQQYASSAIAKKLNESDFQVTLKDKQGIRIKIEEVLDETILSIKLEFKNKNEISSGMVRVAIKHNIYRNWTCYKLES